MRTCADPSFGLNHQALAILHFLAGLPPSFAPYDQRLGQFNVCIQTFPWYNGREQGVALVIYRGSSHAGPCQVVAFGECRGTDGIFVEWWEEPCEPLNGPNVFDRDQLMGAKEQAGAKTIERTSFDNGQVGAAVHHIYHLLETFYLERPQLQLVGRNR